MKYKKPLLSLLLLSFYLISVLLSLPLAYAAALKHDVVILCENISSYSAARSHSGAINKKAFYELGRYWLWFSKYTGTASAVVYTTGTDLDDAPWGWYGYAFGGEWGVGTENPAYRWSVYKDGNEVHVGWHPEDGAIQYRKGILRPNGTSVWGSSMIVEPSWGTDTHAYVEVALGSDNHPWVAYSGVAGTQSVVIARADNEDGSGGAGAWTKTEWNQQGNFGMSPCFLHPLPDGKMYSISQNMSKSGDYLKGAIWNTTAGLELNETITDDQSFRMEIDSYRWAMFSVASDVEGDGTNVIHLAYRNASFTQGVIFYKRRDENGVWGAEEIALEDDHATWVHHHPALCLDHTGGSRISLFTWCQESGGYELYRTLRADDAWGSPDSLYTDTTGQGEMNEIQTSMWSESNGEIFIGWHNRGQGDIFGCTMDVPAVARFVASPEIHATFFVNETDLYTTPETLGLSAKNYTFRADDEVTYGGDTYSFDFWHVVGVDRDESYYTASIEITLTSDMNFTIYYITAEPPPSYPELYDYSADPTTTLYMRSDTHTINEILGYKLSEAQSVTGASDVRTASGTLNTSYGCRVWIVEQNGEVFEITSGSPVATVTKTDNSSSKVSGTWISGDRSSYVVNALLVRVYQRFDGTWSLRRNFISHDDMMIRLPSSTWTFYYYINHTQAGGSTYSTFWHGSTTYNSRMSFFYKPISPFDTMAYNLAKLDLFAFTFTPWTYHLGDMFWGIMLFFILITTYNRYGSIKPVIAVSWFFGGAGGILSTMIPAAALQLSWLLLAFAFAATLFKLMR